MKHLAIFGFLFGAALSGGYSNNGKQEISRLGQSSQSRELSINAGNKFSVSTSGDYQLSCDGANGDVSYHIDGLPEGASLVGNKI